MARYAIHRVIRADTQNEAVKISKSDFGNATVTAKSKLLNDPVFRNLHFDYIVVGTEDEDDKIIVVVLDHNHEIDDTRLEVLEKVAQLRVYRRLPFRQRWSTQLRVAVFGGSGGLMLLVSSFALNVSSSVKNVIEVEARKSPAEAPPTSTPSLPRTSPPAPALAPATPLIPAPGATGTPTIAPRSQAAARAPQSQAGLTVQPGDLGQAMQAYVAEQLKPYPAANAATAHLRLWSPPEAVYDKRSETARCELDAGIEGDDGGILLARRIFGPENSGEGSTPEQVTESACRAAADKIVSGFRVQQ